jgi:uncharacterized protein YndB with AHSA1/START domain
MTLDPPTELPSESDQMIVAAEIGMTPGAVFAHFIDAQLLVLWWPQEASVEPWENGHYLMSWPSMNWKLSGLFTTFEPDKRLAFTWQWAHRPELPVRTVDVLFARAASGCRVMVTHGVYGDSAAEQEDRQGHIDGWIYFLGQLQSLPQQEPL